MSSLIGKTLYNNHYQILQKIGEGGFGDTYQAIDLHREIKSKSRLQLFSEEGEREGEPVLLKSKKIKVKSKKIIPINKLRGFHKDVLFLALRVSKQMFLLRSINKFRGL